MNTRSVALVLLKLMLACFTSLPAIAVAQVATDRFAWVALVDYFGGACSQYCFDYRTAGIAVQAFGYQIMLTQDPTDGAPSWSPDGTRIAFQRAGEIMVINVNGSTPANITNHPATDRFPVWSPDGTRIAFLSDRDGQSSQPYLMNVDGSGVVRLTNGIPVRGRIAWSPDGTKIAFDCEVDPGNFDICSINTDGTGFARLTTDPGYDSGPAWSPDGSRIAFSTSRFGGVCDLSDDSFAFVDPNELAIMNADGTGFSRVGPDGTPGSGPSWSPDGNRIVFEVARYYECRYVTSYIVQINTDGTLVTGIGTGFSAAWGPAVVTPSGPAVALSTPSLGFGFQLVGITSSPRTIELINYGSGELVISSIVATGDFAQTNTCNGTVAAGVTCPITVTFTPMASGTRSGAISITDNAPGSPHMVSLSGVGNIPPIASFTATCVALTCTFDGSASADPDGSVGTFRWRYGEGIEVLGTATVSHTYAASGAYTVTLTVMDKTNGVDTETKVVTVPGFMHVGDLDGTRTNQQNTWTATVTATVEDSSHNRVTNATVNGNWTNGGASSCTTNASGQCAVSKSGILKKTGSATFTVSGVTHASMLYNSTDNHDPDGDGTGTSITVGRP